MTRAVFFDVDFTLIYPGPTFQGSGYQAFCESHGMTVDAGRFGHALVSAASILDGQRDGPYDGEVFVEYIRHIIGQMGGGGATLDACAREIYREWATNHHFELYDDTAATLSALAAQGLHLGLISNSHRCLTSFQSHFELRPFIAGAVSSAEHGFVKPSASIFRAAMELVGVEAHESVMVGDSIRHDVEGALNAGIRAVFLHRNEEPHPRESELLGRGVPTIRSLAELPRLVLDV